MGRRVGPDAGEGQQPALDLVVGQLGAARGEQLLEVQLAGGDLLGDLAQVGAAVAGAGDVR